MLTDNSVPVPGSALPWIARNAVAEKLNARTTSISPGIDESHPWLSTPGASFVTLRQKGVLRGCIGTIQPYQSLFADVKNNAVTAALRDPRFAPLSKEELPFTVFEVSVLTTPEPMHVFDEADVLAQLRPGTDGVILAYGSYHSTFLPQVWEYLPDPRQFLAALKQKAGLPPDFWSEAITLSRYMVNKWSDQDT